MNDATGGGIARQPAMNERVLPFHAQNEPYGMFDKA
jgi:hypothetical protein